MVISCVLLSVVVVIAIKCSGRSKGQNWLAFFGGRTYYKLLISIPLKMYSKFDQLAKMVANY